MMNLREWALPVYTILMQLAVGSFFLLWLLRAKGKSRFGNQALDRVLDTPLWIIAFTTIASVMGSHFHLSKPFQSFLAVFNFRSSWLSREILFTMLFLITYFTLIGLQRNGEGRERLRTFLGWLAILFGMITVYCMANIYLLPAQAAWNSATTIISFFAATILLGAVSSIAMLLMDLKYTEVWKPDLLEERQAIVRDVVIWLVGIGLMTLIAVYINNYYQITMLRNGDQSAHMSLELLTGLYQPLFIMRLLSPLLGMTWLVISILQLLKPGKLPGDLLMPAYISCILVTVGEIMGRFLFYATHVRTGI